MKSKISWLAACMLAFAMTAFESASAQTVPYLSMAPLEQYLMPQEDEIALARSAAPRSVSDEADVMVLGKEGYVTVVKGTNGFLCIVERGWAGETSFSDFWNPKQRAPNCFNRAAARTFAQIYLMKTRLVLAGYPKQEILKQTIAAMDSRELLPPEPGAMCYMMSKQQYLNDKDRNWHPHMMFFVAGDVAASWGANLPGSPVIAANDAEERVTIFMMMAEHWSDGTAAPMSSMTGH